MEGGDSEEDTSQQFLVTVLGASFKSHHTARSPCITLLQRDEHTLKWAKRLLWRQGDQEGLGIRAVRALTLTKVLWPVTQEPGTPPFIQSIEIS